MAVDDLPMPVVTFLNAIGIKWPYINEDSLAHLATLTREFGQAVEQTHEDATQAVAGIAQGYQGAWILGHGGRPEEYCHRQLIDAVLYLTDNGIKWRAMPADFPDWDDCYRFFRRWKTQGLLTIVDDRLRRACRVQAGRDPGLSCPGGGSSGRGGRVRRSTP